MASSVPASQGPLIRALPRIRHKKYHLGMKRNFAAIVASYLTVYVVWGSTYLAINWAVKTIPPYYLVGLRFLASGLAFLAIALAQGKLKPLPGLKEFLSAGFMGLFLLVLGNGLVSVGEMEVDSYLAAIIISATPLIVALFNRTFFREKLSWIRIVSMALGLAGVAVLLYEGGGSGLSIGKGIVFVVAGFLSWGFATSVGHKLPVHANNLVNSGLQMCIAGTIALVFSLFAYPPPAVVLPGISLKSWMALAYLASVGGVAFYAYSYLLKHEPSRRIVSYSIVNPLIAVLIGIALGGEKPVIFLIPGMIGILTALVLMLYGDAIRAKFKRKSKPRENAISADIDEEGTEYTDTGI
jgi:drug/metabolite transporter (DMT)-like permease